MTRFDKIFKLSKKLSQALLKDKGFHDLEKADFLSEDEKVHIKQHLSDEEIKENLELLNQIDKEGGWEHIQHRMSSHGKVKTKNRPPISSFYKVAAVVALLVSLTYLIYDGHTDRTLLKADPVQIVAGTDKAILTLEDGSDVVLEKGSTFKNASVHSNGERLEYTSTDVESKTAFNVLTIPRGGQYQILLSDSTRVWLNADTQIKYPVHFVDGKPRNLELVYGEAYFKVSPSSKHKGSVFKVVSKFQEVEVLGTAFNIKTYKDERHIYTTLVEGRVQIGVDEKKQQLIPGDQLIVNRDTKQSTKHQVHVEYDIAWVRGYFHFKDKPLKDIMMVLSRWYDVEIDFEAQELETIKFSGLLNRRQDIEDILDGFRNTKFINAYGITNSTITIK